MIKSVQYELHLVNVLLRVSLCFAKPFIGWEPSILSPECAGNL